MAISVTALTSGTSNTSGTAFSSASFTISANALVISSFNQLDNGQAPSAVAGLGLTWVQVVSQAQSDMRVSSYRTMASTGTTGTMEMLWGAGSAQIRVRWSVKEFLNVDTNGVNGSAAIVQSAGTASVGTTVLTVGLAAFGTVANAAYGAFSHRASEATTAGTGFNELHDISAGGYLPSLQTEWVLGDDDPDASWVTSSAACAVAFEIKATAAGGAAFNLERLERHYIRGAMRGGLRGVA